MKKYLLIFFLFLLPYLASAQNKSIDGFMDIPFGSDSTTVKAAILAKGGKQDPRSVKDFLVFSNFSLSQRAVTTLAVKFVDNKAYDAFFTFLFSVNGDIFASYDSWVADITAVYGKPLRINNFNEFSNNAKIRKIRSKDISIQALWQSKNKNTISIEIAPVDQLLEITLVYEDDALFDINSAKRRSDL